MYKVHTLANYIDVHPNALYAKIKNGDLISRRETGMHLIHREDLQKTSYGLVIEEKLKKADFKRAVWHEINRRFEHVGWIDDQAIYVDRG
tara:strand:- start:4796 stop:5065 length:270 start_codon:yes stop_codon:yes gene_type:complete